MKNRKTLLIGIITLLFFGIGGILIIELYRKENFLDVLLRGSGIPWQILYGTFYGIFSSFICLLIINRDFFRKEKEYYKKKVSYLDLNYHNIIFISLCAGIGEEIFFRAALQPILGIWPTAILFVLLHGYLNPFNWRISIYGGIMIFIMAGLGFLYERVGLVSVMAAHTIIDIVLFFSLYKSKAMGDQVDSSPLESQH